MSLSRNRAWTDRAAPGIIAAMGYIVLTLLLFLSACGADPATLGIAGRQMVAPPIDPGEAQTGIAGAPQTGTQYAPSMQPNTGSGKFWGYN